MRQTSSWSNPELSANKSCKRVKRSSVCAPEWCEALGRLFAAEELLSNGNSFSWNNTKEPFTCFACKALIRNTKESIGWLNGNKNGQTQSESMETWWGAAAPCGTQQAECFAIGLQDLPAVVATHCTSNGTDYTRPETLVTGGTAGSVKGWSGSFPSQCTSLRASKPNPLFACKYLQLILDSFVFKRSLKLLSSIFYSYRSVFGQDLS